MCRCFHCDGKVTEYFLWVKAVAMRQDSKTHINSHCRINQSTCQAETRSVFILQVKPFLTLPNSSWCFLRLFFSPAPELLKLLWGRGDKLKGSWIGVSHQTKVVSFVRLGIELVGKIVIFPSWKISILKAKILPFKMALWCFMGFVVGVYYATILLYGLGTLARLLLPQCTISSPLGEARGCVIGVPGHGDNGRYSPAREAAPWGRIEA